jgi:glutaminyl-peptide cyclotransferase
LVSDESFDFILPQNSHTPMPLSDEQIIKVASLSNINHFEDVLDTILIPRVVGTGNHEFVKQVISN